MNSSCSFGHVLITSIWVYLSLLLGETQLEKFIKFIAGRNLVREDTF